MQADRPKWRSRTAQYGSYGLSQIAHRVQPTSGRRIFAPFLERRIQGYVSKNPVGRARTLELRHGSVSSLPFADNTFHKAIAVNSMQIWPDAIAGLREMWRIMKSGGTIALGFTQYSGQKREGLIDKLVAAGFTKARVVEKGGNFCAVATKP